MQQDRLVAELGLAALLSLCAALALPGAALDSGGALSQPLLFGALHFASLCGASLGALHAMQGARTGKARALHGLLALLAWRAGYFPIVVFSGHVAAIAEWLLAKTPLPVFVYPVFLMAVALLHAVAAVAACWLLRPPRNWIRIALAPAFFAALCVSFAEPADLHPLPDTNWSLARVTARAASASAEATGAANAANASSDSTAQAAARAAQQRGGNPYLAALGAAGYWPNQRVVLLAAGLTYGAIPPSPWARAVRDLLSELFAAQPHGGAALRVREHYLAYHAAHRQIGCQRRGDCSAPH